MPDFTVKVVSESVYGPFAYGSADALRKDIIGGKLKMNDIATTLEEGTITRLVVKEVKKEK